MKQKTGLVMATMLEAEPFIKGLSLMKTAVKPFPVYSGDHVELIISGIGKVYSALAASILIREYGSLSLINAGAAGSLRFGFKTSDILHIHEVIDYDRPKLINKKMRVMKPDIMPGYKNASLATLDRPVITAEDRKNVGQYADLIDMEGAGFLQSCRTFGADAYLWKMVSDTAEHEKDEDIISNIKIMIDTLFSFMMENVFPAFLGR
jgi:nucleoside phosphorylase